MILRQIALKLGIVRPRGKTDLLLRMIPLGHPFKNIKLVDPPPEDFRGVPRIK